ncbi:oligosaccharide flippase family protein [Aerococcus viridans]|uniref:oligosaccharide flippase family protein n=1 Tax=Aerococcus viridans TaxID=1377 RepID=UPI003B2151EC
MNAIKKLINKAKQDSLIKNFSVLFSGTAVAQVISFILSPVLTRLYSPAEFGVNSIYNSFLLIGAVFATLRLQTPIAMTDKNEERSRLTELSLSTSLFFGIVIGLLALVFPSELNSIFGVESPHWFWVLPISMLFIGAYETFFQALLSEQRYRDMTVVSIAKVTVMGAAQIGLVFFNLGYMSLILGNLISYIVVVLYMILKVKYKIQLPDFSELSKTFKQYAEYPKYAFPAELLSISSTQLLPIMISFLYNSEVTGYYSLANRLIGVPITVIGNSLRQVYLKEATLEYKQTGNVYKTFKKTSTMLLGIAFPIGLVLAVIAPWFFGIFFGEGWAIAGTYLQLLVPVFLARFIVTPIMGTIYIVNKTKLGILVNGALMSISIILTIIFSVMAISEPEPFFISYSLAYLAVYLVIYIYFWIKISQKERRSR